MWWNNNKSLRWFKKGLNIVERKIIKNVKKFNAVPTRFQPDQKVSIIEIRLKTNRLEEECTSLKENLEFYQKQNFIDFIMINYLCKFKKYKFISYLLNYV